MIRLSIIVPLYKSASYMPKCLDSLTSQDIPYEEYEIILVNDGSPDNSLQIAESYVSRFPNIVVLSQENKGASGARNTGMDVARGEYVRFVDPDDYVPHNSFSAFLNQMDRDNLDILRFDYRMVDEEDEIIDKPVSASHIDYSPGVMDGKSFLVNRLGYACFIWTFVFRRSIISDNGIRFYEGDYYDDTPWTPRVCIAADRVDSTSAVGYCYYQRSDSLVHDDSDATAQKKVKGYAFLIEELRKQRDALSDAIVNKWYDGMISHCVVTLLSIVSSHFYERHSDIIANLRNIGVFPLSGYQSECKAHRKIWIINISPALFCWMIHLKRR